jgi:hypothetical protein
MPRIYGEGQQKAFSRLLRGIDGEAKDATSNIRNAYDQSRDGKLEKIQKWLSAADPSSNYEQALKQRQNNTGFWLLNSDQYRKWKTEPASFLWLHGIPGSGKTILSSTILQDLLRAYGDNKAKAVVLFYFDFNDSRKQNAESMLRSLICQLSRKTTNIPSRLENVFLLHEKQPSSDKLIRILHQLTESFAEVSIVLDALDECSQRSELMDILTTIGGWQLQKSHIIVTSRRERYIEDTLQIISSQRDHISFESKVIDEEEIETTLIQGSQGMYAL